MSKQYRKEMKRNKVIGIIGAVILSLAIVLMACAPAAPPAPPPAPTPTPTPTPTPAPPPPPKEEFIQIITSPEGQAIYFIGLELKDLLAKHSDWLRATVKAASISNTAELARKPELRTSAIVATNEWEDLKARKAMAPYTESYTGQRALLLSNENFSGYITLKPEIKTFDDFERVKVGTYPKGTVAETTVRWVLEDLGLKVDLQYMGGKALAGAVRDGLLDVARSAATFDGEGWLTHPSWTEVMETKEWYPVNFPSGSLDKIKETHGWVGGVATVPAGSLPNQTADWHGHVFYPSWWVDESLDDRIVTELLRVIYENNEEFRKAHISIQGLTHERMAHLPISEELFHPAAVKFYKDKGIPVGF